MDDYQGVPPQEIEAFQGQSPQGMPMPPSPMEAPMPQEGMLPPAPQGAPMGAAPMEEQGPPSQVLEKMKEAEAESAEIEKHKTVLNKFNVLFNKYQNHEAQKVRAQGSDFGEAMAKDIGMKQATLKADMIEELENQRLSGLLTFDQWSKELKKVKGLK